MDINNNPNDKIVIFDSTFLNNEIIIKDIDDANINE